MTKIDLVVLESLWDNDFENIISVKPFFDGLSKLYDINIVYLTFYDVEDIGYFIKKTKSKCSNYYIATHGSKKCLHGLNNNKIDSDSLNDIFKNSKGKGLYFGSCKFINKKNAEKIIKYTNADWVAGYNRDVDWFDSTIVDIAFWRYYLKGVENKIAKEKQWRVAPEIYKKYPFSKELGFSVFDKAQYEREIHDSLSEFMENE